MEWKILQEKETPNLLGLSTGHETKGAEKQSSDTQQILVVNGKKKKKKK
jgi:hypothetical protein